MGVKSPKGKNVWNESTVKSILTNEKCKGCALLQKHYPADYLTKKIVRNDDAVYHGTGRAAEAVPEFDDVLRGSLAEHVTVGRDKTMVFKRFCGIEMVA